ncbi:alcohol dehydrogenase [Vibrio parahaemolyticus]|nr:alcohol dehydrogenase [Vibrio parahaemolyticus]
MGGKTDQLDDQQAAELAVDLIRQLSKRVGIPAGFSSLGIKQQDFQSWVDKALADPCLGGNPRQPTAKEIERLYLECM